MRKFILMLNLGVCTLFGMNCVTNQLGSPANTLGASGINGFYGTSYSPKDKEGEVCAESYSLLSLSVAVGNASIQEAAKKAGITKITSVSHATKFNKVFTQEVCTIVRGQ